MGAVVVLLDLRGGFSVSGGVKVGGVGPRSASLESIRFSSGVVSRGVSGMGSVATANSGCDSGSVTGGEIGSEIRKS